MYSIQVEEVSYLKFLFLFYVLFYLKKSIPLFTL